MKNPYVIIGTAFNLIYLAVFLTCWSLPIARKPSLSPSEPSHAQFAEAVAKDNNIERLRQRVIQDDEDMLKLRQAVEKTVESARALWQNALVFTVVNIGLLWGAGKRKKAP